MAGMVSCLKTIIRGYCFSSNVALMVLVYVNTAFGMQKQEGEHQVVSLYYHEGSRQVEHGGGIYIDKLYPFDQIPEFIQGLDYIQDLSEDSLTIKPLTEGELIVFTPISDNFGSRAQELENDGFMILDSSSVNLLKDYPCEFIAYMKVVKYENFRLNYFRYKSMVIPFFQSSSLASINEPAQINHEDQMVFEHQERKWQGCPSIEVIEGDIWTAWFTGGDREPDRGNYGVISRSKDSENWKDPYLTITHPNPNVRVMDPQLWKDPKGRLWIFWVQNMGAKGFDGLWGTWAVTIENPTDENISFSHPKRLFDGLMRNKPIVLNSGGWLFPSYNWVNRQSTVYISEDLGHSFEIQGGPTQGSENDKNFYEHMVVQNEKDELWMLQRNIQQSYSNDLGKSWMPLQDFNNIVSANSRFYIGKLKSGKLILVWNNDTKRANLSVSLSSDHGVTWSEPLVIDDRNDVSYPDLSEDEGGNIYIIYDRGRRSDMEILLAKLTEQEIMEKRIYLTESFLRKVISNQIK